MVLTADRNTEYSLGDLLSIPVAAAAEIFAGGLVCTDADGYAVAAADTANYVFEGVATEHVDNSDGEDGDLSVVVRRRGRYHYDMRSAYAVTQAAMSGCVYVYEDDIVADDSMVDNDVLVGIIDRVEDDGSVWVSIDRAVLACQAWTPVTTTTAAPTTTTAAL